MRRRVGILAIMVTAVLVSATVANASPKERSETPTECVATTREKNLTADDRARYKELEREIGKPIIVLEIDENTCFTDPEAALEFRQSLENGSAVSRGARESGAPRLSYYFATLYQHSGWGGDFQHYYHPYSPDCFFAMAIDDVGSFMNDRASASTSACYQIRFWEDPSQWGDSDNCSNSCSYVGAFMNDRISSFLV